MAKLPLNPLNLPGRQNWPPDLLGTDQSDVVFKKGEPPRLVDWSRHATEPEDEDPDPIGALVKASQESHRSHGEFDLRYVLSHDPLSFMDGFDYSVEPDMTGFTKVLPSGQLARSSSTIDLPLEKCDQDIEDDLAAWRRNRRPEPEPE